MDSHCPTPAEALAIAQMVLASRYPDAAFAFAAGAIIRGEGTLLSDIDLVVLYDLDAARRESFTADGVPVEAFVHDPETLAWFVDADVARGRPSILNMVAEGAIIGSAHERARVLQRAVAQRLAEGPPPLTTEALNVLRYEITDALDDLRGERSQSEIMAIGAVLHPRLVELALRGRGRWNGTGKWAPRLLAAAGDGLAGRFDEAFRALFAAGNCDLVIALAEQEMQPHGGRLFEGDRRAASPDWRA